MRNKKLNVKKYDIILCEISSQNRINYFIRNLRKFHFLIPVKYLKYVKFNFMQSNSDTHLSQCFLCPRSIIPRQIPAFSLHCPCCFNLL